jgi:hypothetical protein
MGWATCVVVSTLLYNRVIDSHDGCTKKSYLAIAAALKRQSDSFHLPRENQIQIKDPFESKVSKLIVEVDLDDDEMSLASRLITTIKDIKMYPSLDTKRTTLKLGKRILFRNAWSFLSFMSPDIRNISDGKLMKTWQNFTQQTRRARKKDVQKEVDIDEPILHTPSNTNSIHNPNRNEVLESSIGINELMESCDTDQGSEITKSNPSTEPQPKKRRKQYVTLGNEHLTFICNRVEYFKKTNTNQYGIWPQVTKEFFIKYDIDISEGAIKKSTKRL